MRMYIAWFDTERTSIGKISIVGTTAPHTSSSRGGIKSTGKRAKTMSHTLTVNAMISDAGIKIE